MTVGHLYLTALSPTYLVGSVPDGAAPASGICLPTVICPSQIIDAGSGLSASVAKAVAASVLDSVGSGLTQAAAWVVGEVMNLIMHSTSPDVTARWFSRELSLMERVALTVVLPVLLAATIGPVLRQDARRLFRVWAVGLPLAIFAGLAGSQLTQFALSVTDALCGLVIGSHSQEVGSQFSAAMTNPTILGAPVFVQMVVAVLTLCGAVLVWLELSVRSAGVYVATFFMPLGLIAYIWPATAGIAKRAVEILVSLILSKFVIVASISLGLVALANGGVDATVSGAAILLIAAFAPFTLFRLAPVVEASAIAHLEGMARRPGRAAARTVTAAASAQVHPVTQMVMSSASSGSRTGMQGDGGLGARPVSAQFIPEAKADYLFGGGATGTGASTTAGAAAGERVPTDG